MDSNNSAEKEMSHSVKHVASNSSNSPLRDTATFASSAILILDEFLAFYGMILEFSLAFCGIILESFPAFLDAHKANFRISTTANR